MACRGVHFAITTADSDRLLAASSANESLSIVQDDIEEKWDKIWLYETDKAWDAIHRCLTDGTLDPKSGVYPLKVAILNGRPIDAGPNYLVSLTTPEQVQDVAAALTGISREWLSDRYDAVDPTDYGTPKSQEDFDYTWENFQGLATFFQRHRTLSASSSSQVINKAASHLILIVSICAPETT
jgi:hypothetical protein